MLGQCVTLGCAYPAIHPSLHKTAIIIFRKPLDARVICKDLGWFKTFLLKSFTCTSLHAFQYMYIHVPIIICFLHYYLCNTSKLFLPACEKLNVLKT